MAENFAVLIVAYLRKEHIAGYLDTFIEAEVSDIYFAMDAAKTIDLRNEQQAMLRELTDRFRLSGIKVWIWQREKNLGPAVSVYTAVDWFFQFESEGIILEDDLAFNIDFLTFAQKCLKDFKTDNQVWLVSGNQFFENEIETDKPVFSHYPLIWGWATWEEKWKEIRGAIVEPEKRSGRVDLSARTSYWELGRKRSLSGKVDAWDIPLVSQMWNKDKLCIQPPKNLVSNVGADAHSTHTAAAKWPLMHKVENLLISEDKYILDNSPVVNTLDDLLSKKFYKIRFRHRFLPIYAPLLDLLTPNKYKENLKSRIDNVEIPKRRVAIDAE
jgi:GR25 family glycosyltransferase involved in LPS biosynthesis